MKSLTPLTTATPEFADWIVDGKNLLGRSLTFEEIQEATGDFNIKNAISEYGSSVVSGTHAILGDIAVSTFLKSDNQGILRFVERSKWAHTNVATPIAYCSEENFHLIYDFQYRCSLKDILLKDEVDVIERLKIAVDIAKGLRHIVSEDSLLKLSPLTSDKIWLRKNGTAVIADISGSCGGTSGLTEEFGRLLMELLSPAPLSVGILAERCCNVTDSEDHLSFDEVVDVLEGVLATEIGSSHI